MIQYFESQTHLETLKFSICTIESLSQIWEHIAKIHAYEIDIKLDQILHPTEHLNENAIRHQITEFYKNYNPSI